MVTFDKEGKGEGVKGGRREERKMDLYLIITIVVLSFVILAACVLLMIKFSHPGEVDRVYRA